MKISFRVSLIITLSVVTLFSTAVTFAQIDQRQFSGLRWRNIGPFHGGRISAVSGAVGDRQSGVFYAGAPIGGLWKTTSGGVTWFQIFDQFQNVDSIGAVQVAPSDPNIVYVGTGDSVQGPSGDGMYKSTDAGKTFVHIGLEETTKINKIIIDPKDPDHRARRRRKVMRRHTAKESIARPTAAKHGPTYSSLRTPTARATWSSHSTSRT